MGSSRKPSTPQYPERIHELLYRIYAIQERIACYIEIKKTSKLIKASHRCIDRFIHRKKLASVGAANQVFFVVTKSAGTAPTASASGKL
jgi:hypothetical protein